MQCFCTPGHTSSNYRSGHCTAQGVSISADLETKAQRGDGSDREAVSRACDIPEGVVLPKRFIHGKA